MEGEEAGKHERNPPPFLALKTQKGNHESRKVIAQGKEGREGGREERKLAILTGVKLFFEILMGL
jgi:hypothetical protein